MFWINFTTYGSLTGSNVAWLSSKEYLKDLEDQGKCKMMLLHVGVIALAFTFEIILQHFFNVYMTVRKFSRSIQILLTSQALKTRHCLRFDIFYLVYLFLSHIIQCSIE